ncbi:MAG: STAS domain-containing protein [Calditrichia bacterium]
MEGIQVSTEVAGSQNQVSIIKVGGFIDTTTSSEVERALNSLLKQNRYNVVIDLGNVDYISSAGWGIFISEIKSIREQNGDLKLVRMIPDVYEIFELLEFHHILDVYDSVEEAVDKFEESIHRPEGAAVAQPAMHTHRTEGKAPERESRYFDTKTEITIEEEEEEGFRQEGKEKIKDQSPSMRSLEDKIKNIVAHEPQLGAYKINKILNTEKYGYTKVGWFGVRSVLNQLGLSSRKNRKNFAQQFSK